ncbi:MAG TPA: MASE1 domain-containing protein, partial [Pirellulales bacterium]
MRIPLAPAAGRAFCAPRVVGERSPGESITRTRGEWFFEIVVFAALHLLAGLIGFALALGDTHLTLVWPATGVSISILWLRGATLWPAILIGGFLTGFANSGSPVFSMFAGAGNALEALIAVTLLNRWGFSARFDRGCDVFRLFLAGPLLGVPVCAAVGSAGLAVAGMTTWSTAASTWLPWFCANALGALCIAPILLIWLAPNSRRLSNQSRIELFVIALVYIATELVLARELGRGGPWSFVQAYLPFPFLLCAALRAGPAGAAAAVFFLTILTAWRCSSGVGEPWYFERIQSLAPVTLFMAVAALTALVLAANHEEKAQSAEALEKSEAEARELALVASRTQHGVAICNADRQIEWCNSALKSLTGLGPDATLGRPLEVLLALQFSNGQLVAEAVRKLHLGQGAHVEGWVVREDGARYWAEVDVEPIDDQLAGGSRRWAYMQRDCSERQEAHAALRSAKEAAEAAHRAKTEFLANMSHEIRTPMTAIVGYADLLAREEVGVGAVSVERRQALEAVNRNGHHLLAIVDDMLELSNAELGRTAIDLAPFAPAQLVEEIVQTFRPRATARGLEMSVHCDPSTPCLVGSDPRCVRQVLRHLLANAVKFTERGSVRVTIASPAERCLTIAVADSGLGLSPERAAGLFQPFFQADGSMSRRFGGAGLGLAVSKRLATLLGGDVVVESRPNQGSVFTFSFRFEPRAEVGESSNVLDAGSDEARVADSEADTVEDVTKVDVLPNGSTSRGGSRPHDETVEARRPELLGLRVLLAEDGPDNQTLLCAILRKAGAEVVLAENGSEAVHAATESERAKTP